MLHSAFSLLTKKKNLVASCSIFFHVLIFFFIGILSNINKIFTFLHFLPETPKLRAGQTFLTVPYFQTCSKRWNARHILSCAPQEPGRRLDSTALPTPHKRSRQGDGEAVCLTLGFFSSSDWFSWSFLIETPLGCLGFCREHLCCSGGSGTAGRLAPASPWLSIPSCRDLTFP